MNICFLLSIQFRASDHGAVTRTSRPFFIDRVLRGRWPGEEKIKKTENMESGGLAQVMPYTKQVYYEV